MASLGTIILLNTGIILANTIIIGITTHKFSKIIGDYNATRY